MSEPVPTTASSRNSPAPLALFWTVALTGALPYLFARLVMNPSVAAATAAHCLFGATAALSIRWIARAVARPTVWATARLYGWPTTLTVAALTGAGLLAVALAGRSIGPLRGVYIFHVAAGFGTMGLAVAGPLARLAATNRPRFVRAPVIALAALALSIGALAGTRYAAESYFSDLTAANPTQAHNPLFPAGTRISPGSIWDRTPAAESCGQTGCHPDIVRQWSGSPHAHAATDGVYLDSLRGATKRLQAKGTRWCGGCHAPIALAAGKGGAESGAQRPAGVPRGVDCLACHAMAAVPSATGNGAAYYAAPEAYPFASSKHSAEKWAHGFLLRVRPAPHRASLAGPRNSALPSAMCLPCHQLSLGPPQNGYKFLPYDDTWSDWLASTYSGESAHTFQDAPRRAGCVDCHMREAGAGALTHGTASATTTMAESRAPQPVSVEVFALRRLGSPGSAPLVAAPLARRLAAAAPGEAVVVDVLVENRNVGHSFPSGLPSARDVSLDLTVADGAGRIVAFEPGLNSSRASLIADESGAAPHTYGLLGLNRAGAPVGMSDFYTMVAPINNHVIPSGEAEVARFRFTVPRSLRGVVRLTATLRRKVSPTDATGHSHHLRVETLATHSVELTVSPLAKIMPEPQPDDPMDAPRLFAYGVGLLRTSSGAVEIAGARAAFTRAIRLRPSNPDYLVALGRSFLAEGDLLSARAQLEQALKIDPKSPRARAYLGTVLLRMGQLEAAVSLLAPLAAEYPRDRLLWLDIGLSRLKAAQYQPAADAFTRALEVAPNDAAAHYNLMRCYTALNRLTEARREEAIFRALQDDEPLTSLVEPFMQSHPQLRRETQSMHTHVLEAIR